MKKKQFKPSSTVGTAMLVILILLFYQYWKIICTMLAVAALGYIMRRTYETKKKKVQTASAISPSTSNAGSKQTSCQGEITVLDTQGIELETEQDELEAEYVEISTSGDESVCPMCARR